MIISIPIFFIAAAVAGLLFILFVVLVTLVSLSHGMFKMSGLSEIFEIILVNSVDAMPLVKFSPPLTMTVMTWVPLPILLENMINVATQFSFVIPIPIISPSRIKSTE